MKYEHPTWREVVRQVDALANENEALRAEVIQLKIQIRQSLSERPIHTLSEEEYSQLCENLTNETS